MVIEEISTGQPHKVQISKLTQKDYKTITKSKFWFDWKQEKKYEGYKLQISGNDDILGLVSLDRINSESRIEIRLLAVSKENRGKQKKYGRIVGNLIAFTCKQSIKLFGEWACVSLVPKTELAGHYQKAYGMLQAGKSLFVDGLELMEIINEYDHD